MKANTKYTVAEILTEAGYKPADVVGKVRVRVAGIPVNDPNKVINLQPEVKSIEVIVGTEAKDVAIEKGGDHVAVSEGATEALEAESKALPYTDEHTAEVEETEEEIS